MNLQIFNHTTDYQSQQQLSIATCEVQESCTDSPTVPTVASGVSRPLCCRLTLTFTLTSVNLSLYSYTSGRYTIMQSTLLTIWLELLSFKLQTITAEVCTVATAIASACVRYAPVGYSTFHVDLASWAHPVGTLRSKWRRIDVIFWRRKMVRSWSILKGF